MYSKVSKTAFSMITAALITAPAIANDPFAEMDAAFETQKSYDTKSSDFQKEFEAFKRQEQQEFESYKEKLAREFSEFKKIYQQENKKYKSALRKVWDDPKTSSRKVWVEYSKDLKEQRSVDFEKQLISLSFSELDNASEKEVEETVKKSLKKLITKNKAQAFEDDVVAQAVEKKSKKVITTLETAEVKPEPILLPLVSDKPSLSDKEIDAIVDRMLSQQKKSVSESKTGKKVVSVSVPIASAEPEPVKVVAKPQIENKKQTGPKVRKLDDLARQQLPKPARQLSNDVVKYSKKSSIDPSLVFAVIETESAFNPMAKSPVPAYGLMQIVPTSAGQDATAKLFGKARILSPSYLYESSKNIEVGTTYLNILYYRYLRGITNEESRLYCSIAAYNTGAGNVAKAFTGKLRLKGAIKEINKLSPEEVYEHLVENLPYDETRKYLVKVRKRIPKYQAANSI